MILCISKSYPNRLTSNTNTILFPRFARILSPTFLIAFKAGAQTKCTRKCEPEGTSYMKKLLAPSKYLRNICRWAAFYTDLPLLMLMWPIRFGSTTISHSILSSSSSYSSFRCHPIYSEYVWCMRWARCPRAVHRLWSSIAMCWDVLYIDMNLFPWYSLLHMLMLGCFFILFHCIVFVLFHITKPFLRTLCVCVCAILLFDIWTTNECKTICNYMWWQMNGVLL